MNGSVWELRIIPFYMILQGFIFFALWIPRFREGTFQAGFFHTRENGVLFWPHIFAEFLTAIGLIVAGFLLGLNYSPGKSIGLIALGALAYTSLNSLNWALADRRQYPLAFPMIFGLVGSIISILVLI